MEYLEKEKGGHGNKAKEIKVGEGIRGNRK